MRYVYVCILMLFSSFANAFEVPIVQVGDKKGNTFLSYNKIALYGDTTNQLTFSAIKTKPFRENQSEYPSLGLSNTTYWFRFNIVNSTNYNKLLLHISYPLLDTVSVFYPNVEHLYTKKTSGQKVDFERRRYESQEIVFDLPIKSGDSALIYLKVKSKGAIVVPISVGTKDFIIREIYDQDVFFGIYIGIIGVMFIYNIFIFLSVRDRDYLFYVIYIIAIGFAQVCLQGYGTRFLWGNYPSFATQGTNLAGALSGIATILFTMSFLKTEYTFLSFDYFLKIGLGLFIAGEAFSLSGAPIIGYKIINFTALFGSIIVVACTLVLAFKGSRIATYYSIALSLFLISVVVYALQVSGILLIPFNIYSRNILLIGSTLEVALLSFALADKINSYRREKDRSHDRMLRAVRDKEEFVRAQNFLLEEKVQNRTEDLEHANNELHQVNSELNVALEHQKRAEGQLIQAEKMASLGRITAGIAHEINNPINFIQSNIGSLDLDIKDLLELIEKYKEITKDNIEEKLREIRDLAEDIDLETLYEEIPMLLTGMKEGTTRTARIVSGLRVFSRLDEDALKKANIQLGIDSTLRLLQSMIPPDLEIVKAYNEIPLVECNPGKLNQVFMNLITNAIQALSAIQDQRKKRITITTEEKDGNIIIKVSDNGSGIPLDIQDKIFEPFFTTKEVGEGTGLGLSLVFSIIQKHNGTIKVYSELGEGSEFVLILPIHQSRN